jgi:hypothetical protein
MILEAKKYRLMESLMKISDETIFDNLENLVNTYLQNLASVNHLVKPMKEKLDIDELIKTQNYQGADKEFIDGLADEMDIEEPIEVLLKMI